MWRENNGYLDKELLNLLAIRPFRDVSKKQPQKILRWYILSKLLIKVALNLPIPLETMRQYPTP